jgi:hypothetical protein
MMTPEERKEYNKKYYEENKDKIIKKACEKVECPFCKRQVISNNLLKHFNLPICRRKTQLLQQLTARALEDEN